MLEKNFVLNLEARLSGNPFSFDELILESNPLFEREGVPGFIRVLLAFIDEFVIAHWYAQHGKHCCESPKFRRAGSKSKNIMTTIGRICFEWTALRCQSCVKKTSSFERFF
jgi:hypothetical protein